MLRIAHELWLLPRNGAIAFMLGYRRMISPLYGEVCRYHPSCSRYALEVFQYRGLVCGILLSAWRLLRCNPFSPGGIDDAPPPKPRSSSRRDRFAVHLINEAGFARPQKRKA